MPIHVVSRRPFNPFPWPIPIPAEVGVAAGDARVSIGARGGVAAVAAAAYNFTVGQVQPDASNTGPRIAVGDMDVYSGSATISANNTVLEGYVISQYLEITGKNVVLRDCLIRGTASAPASGRGLVRADNANQENLLVEHCELVPQVTSNLIDGIQGRSYTARKNKVHDVVDFFRVRNANVAAGSLLDVEISENYCYDHTWFQDSGQSDNQTHNDGIQLQGGDGSGSLIRGNALWGRRYSTRSSTSPAPPDRGTGTEDNGRYAQGALAGIQYTNLSGYTSDLDIWDNWIFGYERGINAGSAVSTDVGRWWRNRFDDAQGERSSLSAGAGYTITLDPTTTCDTGDGTANQNVYVATATGIAAGTPVTVRRNQ